MLETIALTIHGGDGKLKEYKNYDYLYDNNIKNHISMTEIARNCGVSPDTIKYYMNKYNIVPWYAPKDLPKLQDKQQEVIKLYLDGTSLNKISKLFSCSRQCVRNVLISNNIKLRTLQEAQFSSNNEEIPKEMFDKEWLSNQHWTLDVSVKDIANSLGIDPGTLRRQMNRLGIKTKSCSESKVGLMSGTKHPNWQGGRTKLSLLLREWWHINIAIKASKRDNYTCCLCGKTHTVLHVHHIERFKTIVDCIIKEHPDLTVENNKLELYNIIIKDKRFTSVDNLITLCKRCHRKIHSKCNTISNQVLLSKKGSTTIES